MAGFAFVLSCVFVSACAAAGRTDLRLSNEVSVSDTVLPATPAAVWSVLPSVFEFLEIEAPAVDGESRTIGNPGFRAPSQIARRPLSTYLQCGNSLGGQNADRYEVRLQLAVEVVAAPAGGSLVRTFIDADARPRGVSGDTVRCTSTGALERLIVELVTDRLPG